MGEPLEARLRQHSGARQYQTTDELGLTNSLQDDRDYAPDPAPTLLDTIADTVADTAKDLVQRLADVINGLLGYSSSREFKQIYDPGDTSIPTTPEDVAEAIYERLEASRLEASSKAKAPGTGYTFRNSIFRRPPVANVLHKISMAVRMRAVVEDAQAPFREYIGMMEPTIGQKETHPVNQALTNMAAKTSQVLAHLLDVSIKPMVDEIVRLQKKYKISYKQAYEAANFAGTVYHLKNEGYEAHRNALQKDIDNYIDYQGELADILSKIDAWHDKQAEKAIIRLREDLNKAKSPKGKARAQERLDEYAYDRSEHATREELDTLAELEKAKIRESYARFQLQAYDHLQATDQGLKITAQQADILNRVEGSGYHKAGEIYMAHIPGGITRMKGERMWSDMRKTFTEKELLEIMDTAVNSYEQIYLSRLEAGVAAPEGRKGWDRFNFYVPLAMDTAAVKMNGNWDEGYVPSPTKMDYTRFGYGPGNMAAGAIQLLDRYVANAALEIGQRDFTHLLNAMAIRLKARGERQGLIRIRMNDNGTGPMNHSSQFNKQAVQAPGFLHKEFAKQPDGSYKETFWKIVFMDNRDPIMTTEMHKAMTTVRDTNELLLKAAGLNRWIGGMYTKWRAIFPIVNAVRDLGERFFNVFAHGDYIKADGTVVEGKEIAKVMGGLLADPEFLTTYTKLANPFGKGEAPGNKFAQYYAEAEKSGVFYTWISMTQEGTRKAKLLAGPSALGPVSRAFYKALGSKSWTKVSRTVDGWNNLFNVFPIFIEYAAMREAGIAEMDAAANTMDSMNFLKKGKLEPYGSALWMFFRPTVQGGVNMLRALNPFSKVGAAQQLRGMAGFGALLVFSMILIQFLRAASDDDEEGNAYDALSLGQVASAVYFPLGDGSFAKVPMSFGVPAWAWISANILERYNRGQIDGTEAATKLILGFHRQIFPENFPDYPPSQDTAKWVFQSLAPQYLRPMVDIAVNKNHWGSAINEGSSAPGLREFEKGYVTTPTFWHAMAKEGHDMLGFDMPPEHYRHIFDGYLFGPLQGLMAYTESSRLYERSHETTREQLGPFLTALGAASVWGAKPNIAQTIYYRDKTRIESQLTERGVRTTNKDNKPGEKAEFVAKGMREANFTQEEIDRYLHILELEKELKKLREDRRDKYEGLRFDYERIDEIRDEVNEMDTKGQELFRGYVERFGIRY